MLRHWSANWERHHCERIIAKQVRLLKARHHRFQFLVWPMDDAFRTDWKIHGLAKTRRSEDLWRWYRVKASHLDQRHSRTREEREAKVIQDLAWVA